MYQDAHTQAPGAAVQCSVQSVVATSSPDLSREDVDACIARGHALRARACGEFGQWMAQTIQAGWHTLRHGFTQEPTARHSKK